MAGETRAAADALVGVAEPISGVAAGTAAAAAAVPAEIHPDAEPTIRTESPEGALPLAPAEAQSPELSSSASAPLTRERSQALQQILDELALGAEQFDFFQILRRLESIYRDRPDRPRFGAALRPADEPIRLGQEPSLAFAPAALSTLRPGRAGSPPRLAVHFFGLLGPNGPLPLHLTEYARDRTRNAGDTTFSRFLDVFHHRMLMFFYRAWASAEPTVSEDGASPNPFLTYIGSLVGIALSSVRGRDQFPDPAKLFYAGRLSAQARNAEGLAAMIGDFFQMPAAVRCFVGNWLELPVRYRWRLGKDDGVGRLGLSTTLGAHAWTRQHKFRVEIGPLERAQLQRLLPGGPSLGKLADLVRNYVGDEQRWDLRLFLKEQVDEPWHFGRSRLGWTSWLGKAGKSATGYREDLILDPQAELQGVV
jgi:type VI secretion system protein ImpH